MGHCCCCCLLFRLGQDASCVAVMPIGRRLGLEDGGELEIVAGQGPGIKSIEMTSSAAAGLAAGAAVEIRHRRRAGVLLLPPSSNLMLRQCFETAVHRYG